MRKNAGGASESRGGETRSGGWPARVLAGGLAAAGLVALAACGGGSGAESDPLQPYRDQAVVWQACDPSALGADPDAYAALKNRLSCATIRVPLDYSAPQRGDAAVAIARVAAGSRAQRQGAILLNPGGPGGDGLGLSLEMAALWTGADPSTSTGQQLRAIPQRYDLIGFSPRGVGASSRLYCATTGTLLPERHSSDHSDANIAALVANAATKADACQRNPFTPYVNTDSTVRDMDLIRELLGDAKLNYLGISYGTWLGAWYASAFPERVGRMVLDSSMDVTGKIDVNVVLQAKSMQYVLDRFIPEFAARHDDRYGMGNSPDEIAAVYRALPEPLRVAFDNLLDEHSVLNNTGNIVEGAQLIAAARGLNAVLEANPTIAEDYSALYAKLQDVVFVPGSVGDDSEIREMAQSLLLPYLQALNPPGKPIELDDEESVFLTVICNDTPPTRTDLAYWRELGDQMARDYPHIGGSVTSNACLTWNRPAIDKPALSRTAQAGQILMVQSEFDALTATEGALRSFAQLPTAHMVTVTDYYTHGVTPESIGCVDALIGSYFANGVVPGRTSTCAGPHLPDESASVAARRQAAPAAEGSELAEQARAALRARLNAIGAPGRF